MFLLVKLYVFVLMVIIVKKILYELSIYIEVHKVKVAKFLNTIYTIVIVCTTVVA